VEVSEEVRLAADNMTRPPTPALSLAPGRVTMEPSSR
jgi:hypothetical protein